MDEYLIFRSMKLCDHPLMTRKSGVASWPPQWKCVSHEDEIVKKEDGILEDVSMSDLITNKIFLAMRYREERYISILAFDDVTFTQQLYPLLLENIGHSIKEIGDLDLSHLL
jgi:hypothetical protein